MAELAGERDEQWQALQHFPQAQHLGLRQA
jgi:hypothetical protein